MTKHKNPFYFALLAVAITGLTFFIVAEDKRGFPFAWVSTSANPISEFPFIGTLFGWLPPSVGFDWFSFALDVAFYFAVFYGVYRFATRKKR